MRAYSPLQIERLEGEVEQWMVASEQLQKLGEEAVAEVSEEAESLREEVISLTQKYEEEVHRRREVEAELAQRTPHFHSPYDSSDDLFS